MRFNLHSELAGRHAFLSPSKYSWVNYDEEKFDRVYVANLAAMRGSEMHALAHDLIRLGVKLPGSQRTMNMYVNDAIGYRMTTEQPLFYSINCYGHADAISFRRKQLRIHDLKTGLTPTSEKQLEIYAALFCLEYNIKPFDITTELRIYQSDEVRVYDAEPDMLYHIMDKIVTFNKRIEEIRMEAEL